MNLLKNVFGAVILLLYCNPVISQDFESVMNGCVDKIINTKNLSLSIDVKAIDSKNKSVLQQTTFNLYKDDNILYSEAMGRKTYFDLVRSLVFGVDQESKLATISKLEGDLSSLSTSLSSMLGINSEWDESFNVNASMKGKLMNFAVFFEETLIREIVIDSESNELIEATIYQTEEFNINGNRTLPMLKFKYSYSIDELDISPMEYFSYADNVWTLKKHIGQYKLVNTTTF